MNSRTITYTTITSLLLFSILVPITIVFIQSFLDKPFYWGGEAPNFSLQNYLYVIFDREFYEALSNTIVLSIGTTLFTLFFGVLLSLIVTRTDVPFRNFLREIILTPIFVCPMLAAMAWTMLLGPSGLLTLIWKTNFGFVPWDIYNLPFMILLIGMYYTPYVFLFASDALNNIDPSLEESARISGLGFIKTMIYVTIPLIKHALAFIAILIIIVSFEQFTIPLIIGYPRGINVLTTYMYKFKIIHIPPRYGYMGAVGVIVICITTFLIFIQNKIIGVKTRYVTVTGKAYRPALIKLGRYKYLALTIVFGYLFITTILPISSIILRSFVEVWNPKAGLNFSLNNYIGYGFGLTPGVFIYSLAHKAITNSLILGVGGATIGMILSIFVAYFVYKGGRAIGILDFISTYPNAVPAIVMGVGFLWTYLILPVGKFIYASIFGLLIAYVIRYLPYGIRNISASLFQISKELEESATVCGAPWYTTFTKILLPLLKPAMLSSWLLLFIIFVRETSLSILLYSYHSIVISILNLEWWEMGYTGLMSALATLQISIILGAVVLLRKMFGVRVYGPM